MTWIIGLDQNSVDLIHKINCAGHSKVPDLLSTQIRHVKRCTGNSAHAVDATSNDFLLILG